MLTHEFHKGVITVSQVTPPCDVQGLTSGLVVVRVSATSGTTETLVPEVQVSHDRFHWVHRRTIIDTETEGDLDRTTVPTVEGKLQDVGAFYCQLPAILGNYVRLSFTIAGTDPSFTIDAIGFFQ